MALAHSLGFPRFGYDREQLAARWQLQRDAGIDLLPVADFAGGDQVLAHSLGFGVVAESRSGEVAPSVDLGRWFDGVHHYAIPQFDADQHFRLDWEALFEEVEAARALGHPVKPVLLGPISYLWLGQSKDAGFDRLDLLERLLPVYGEIFQRLAGQGVEWVQIDEPVLALELPQAWKNAFERAYNLLQRDPLKKLVAACFGGLQDNLGVAVGLPVDGLHVDLVGAPDQYPAVLDRLPAYKVLSLGLVDARNEGAGDLRQAFEVLQHAHDRLGERLWVAPSSSLSGASLLPSRDDYVDTELSFGVRKCRDVGILTRALSNPDALASLAACAA